MKRKKVNLYEVADWHNLHFALWKAARGKRARPDVQSFLANAEEQLKSLGRQIIDGSIEHDKYHSFTIRDPKPRKIVALSFPVRVLHHAIINLIGEYLERSQIHTSYACLPGRGVHAAVRRVQRGLWQSEVVVKIDIRHYFASISHQKLMAKLSRRFKGDGFMHLLWKIIDSYQDGMGEGLPIGSLTSQYFANFFLEGFDRYIMSLPETRGYVRYMDDMVWFCRSKMDAKNSLALARNFLEEEGLKIKETPQIIKKDQGITYCGYKVLPHITLLGKRKKRTFIKGIKRWQSSFERGEIDPLELQRGYAGIHGGTLPARANTFRGNVIDYLGKMEV